MKLSVICLLLGCDFTETQSGRIKSYGSCCRAVLLHTSALCPYCRQPSAVGTGALLAFFKLFGRGGGGAEQSCAPVLVCWPSAAAAGLG